MYARLGTTKIQYATPNPDDFMIFSEVIDSEVGYEKPVIVRSLDELDIWFGKEYTSRSYHEELLRSGVNLFLNIPKNIQANTNFSDYIDYSEWPTEFYYEAELPKTGKAEIIYGIYNDQDKGEKYDSKTKLTYDEYVWYFENFVRIVDLPQNNDVNASMSSLNRDTLALSEKGSIIPYYHYNYSGISNIPEFDLLNLEDLNMDKIESGYQTLAFSIEIDQNKVDLSDGVYAIFRGLDKRNYLFYYGELPGVAEKYYQETVKFSNIPEMFLKLKELGYEYVNNTLYSSFPIPVTYFYNIPGVSIEPDLIETHKILEKHQTSMIKFWSKTLGPSNDIDKAKINIEIEKLKTEDYYRITISRFDYLEVYEGPLHFSTETELRLDYQISALSKLVGAELSDDLRGDELLPEGSWVLEGAKKDLYTEDSYKKALKEIFNDGDTTYFDYLLIPDITKYGVEKEIDKPHLKIYETLLGYTTLINCQALIQNSKIKIDEEDIDGYKFNYISDKNNRLVYFYEDMNVKGYTRPGYYLFLRGLLGDTYSISSTEAYYKSPLDNKDPYEDILEDLENHKCNYLIDNGQFYYYKNYQNGKDPETTIWMRFVLGKIARELEKNKGFYLAERMTGKQTSIIESVLGRVNSSFSIIRDITIQNIEFMPRENKMSIDVYTSISDLIENDISINITINYNKS